MAEGFRDAGFIPADFQSYDKQIIAKRPDLVRQAGLGRLKAGTYYAGTVLGLATSGGDAGLLKPYATGNSDGSQNPIGILAESATVAVSGGYGSEANVIVGGTLFQAKLIGLDSGAITALGGKSVTEKGDQLFTFSVAG